MNDGEYRTLDPFDKMYATLEDLPDVTKSVCTTRRVSLPMMGAMTYIVQTLRQRERGDYLFLEYVDAGKSVRIVIPPEVADLIARQRESLSTKIRREHGRRIGKEQAALRKARGEQPAFMKNRGKGKKKRKEQS